MYRSEDFWNDSVMEAFSPGSDDENSSPDRNLHRDDAETIDKLTKEKFRLQLRIYHMEEQMKQTHGDDWKASMKIKIERDECRAELEEKLKLLTQSAKVIEQLKTQLDSAKNEKSKLVKEKDEALRDVSNIESKWRRTEEENSKLKEQLAGLRDKDRRNRERLTHDVEDTENRLRQTDNRLRDSDNRLRETEDRLNDSQRENDRLHDKLQDLQRNSNNIDEELNRKYEEVNGLKDENEELIEEVERLREDLEKAHANNEKHRRRKYNTFEVGVQCEIRMCEKAVQTKSVSSQSSRPTSRVQQSSSRPINSMNSSSNQSLRRTSSVDNLSTRRDILSKYQSGGGARDHHRDQSNRYKPNYADRYNEPPTRYQTLVQSQSRDLGLLRKQLEQSRLTTHKLRGIIEDLTRSDQLIDQRRFIQLARRTIRKLEGELEDRGESATSECNSDSDFEKEENHHIKSRILPTVLEIKNMVNEMREKQNERDTESLRSNFSNSTLSLNNLNQKVQESKRLSRNIQDAFDCDSGKATSPLELNSQSLHENQLIPGLVQDLQSLRLKLDTSVKRNEMLSEKYLEKLEVEATKGTSKGSKVETREFATNTDLTGKTIASYQEEIGALRSFLNSKDDEISRLKQENLEKIMPKPIYSSSPNDVQKSKSKKFKSPAMLDSHLTPPTSDHQSGGEDSERSELTSLTERLNKTRELTRVINMKLESTGHANDHLTSYDLRQVINSLDDMHQIMYKLQSSNEIETSRNENMRLKQKVTKLEALLARSCERLRSTNVLKHGLEYQMTGKLTKAAGVLSRARTNLGTSTPATSSRATSLNGDMESC